MKLEITRNWLIVVFGLVVLFLLTRLYHLQQLPMFTDEGLYARWVETIANDPHQWLIPLIEDGQPPLFIWLNLPLHQVLGDGLLSLRLLAVLFGLGNLLLVMYASYQITKNHLSGLIAGLLYIITPFIWWYDRLGMRESAMSFCFLLAFIGLHGRLVLKSNKHTWLIGLSLLLGLSIKSLAWFLLPIIGLSYLVFKVKPLKADVIALALGVGLPLSFSLTTRTSSAIATKNQIFITSFDKAMQLIKPNLIQAITWLPQYLTWPLLLLALVSGIALAYRRQALAKLITVFSLPLLIEILIADIYFPRYFLFVIPIWLICVAVWLGESITKRSLATKLACLLLIPLCFSFLTWIKQEPTTLPLPAIEQWQYISGWPAGQGVPQMANRILMHQPSLVISETTDVTRTGLAYYQPNLKPLIRPLNTSDKLDQVLVEAINTQLNQSKSVLIVLNRLDTLPQGIEGKLLARSNRYPDGKPLLLYQIIKVNL